MSDLDFYLTRLPADDPSRQALVRGIHRRTEPDVKICRECSEAMGEPVTLENCSSGIKHGSAK